jgi:Transducer of regulated CREB activity, C terminus
LTGADDLLFGHQQPQDHGVRDASSTVGSGANFNFFHDQLMPNAIDDLLLDDALGVGLNPLELDELQMLTDANVLTDPATEDTFRFDQL